MRRLNTINRRLRNLIATNVQARSDAMAGVAGTYNGGIERPAGLSY